MRLQDHAELISRSKALIFTKQSDLFKNEIIVLTCCLEEKKICERFAERPAFFF